jgi:uncharacterized protein DUF1905
MRFTATVVADAKRRVLVPIPFDPDEVWGPKLAHRVGGTIDGMPVRAVVEPFGAGRAILLGAAWRRDCGVSPGDDVAVVLVPEGPQRADLAPDVAAALDAEPAAGAFFDSLAQFYRRGLPHLDRRHETQPGRASRPHRRDGSSAEGRP